MSGDAAIGFVLHPRVPPDDPVLAVARARARSHGYRSWTAQADVAGSFRAERARTVLLVSVGGDGTLLYAARLAAPAGIPLLGVNRGQLGFLTDVELCGLPDAVDQFARRQHRVEGRHVLRAELEPGAGEGEAAWRALAVNEVALKAIGIALVRLRVSLGDEWVGSFDADGMVVATSTGSTAYSLSAGGPPVHPLVAAAILTPLNPHALVSRSLVLPDAPELRLQVERGEVVVAADGQHPRALGPGDRVAVARAPDLLLVRVQGAPGFFDRLRDKTRFGLVLKDGADPVGPSGGWPQPSNPLDEPAGA